MPKNAVITGANRGIGLSLAKQYAKRGWQVYAICRQASPALKATNSVIVDGVDMTDDDSIAAVADQLEGASIDLLINNAGILRNEAFGNIDYQSIQAQFEVNALGPLKLTETLSKHLSNNAKVAMITSRMGSITDNSSGGRYGYRMSKAALNIAAVSLAHDLRSKQVAIAIIHPGLVGTDMIGGIGDVTPDEAATKIITRIEQLNIDNSGSFWHANGEQLPW